MYFDTLSFLFMKKTMCTLSDAYEIYSLYLKIIINFNTPILLFIYWNKLYQRLQLLCLCIFKKALYKCL